MNLLSINKSPETLYLSEQRKIHRHEVINLLAITERGTGQVLDIHREGLSFGCLYPHTFPHEFYLDILDAHGSHIKKIKVRKIRETSSDYHQTSAFELIVGVEFSELSSAQADEFDQLLENNMEVVDFQYPNMF